jgi:hypothetical protein
VKDSVRDRLNCAAIVALRDSGRRPARALCGLAYGPWHPYKARWSRTHRTTFERSTIMGKYFLAWILGVPAIVLVLIYLFFH